MATEWKSSLPIKWCKTQGISARSFPYNGIYLVPFNFSKHALHERPLLPSPIARIYRMSRQRFTSELFRFVGKSLVPESEVASLESERGLKRLVKYKPVPGIPTEIHVEPSAPFPIRNPGNPQL